MKLCCHCVCVCSLTLSTSLLHKRCPTGEGFAKRTLSWIAHRINDAVTSLGFDSRVLGVASVECFTFARVSLILREMHSEEASQLDIQFLTSYLIVATIVDCKWELLITLLR